jgi:hypothetical protein
VGSKILPHLGFVDNQEMLQIGYVELPGNYPQTRQPDPDLPHLEIIKAIDTGY